MSLQKLKVETNYNLDQLPIKDEWEAIGYHIEDAPEFLTWTVTVEEYKLIKLVFLANNGGLPVREDDCQTKVLNSLYEKNLLQSVRIRNDKRTRIVSVQLAKQLTWAMKRGVFHPTFEEKQPFNFTYQSLSSLSQLTIDNKTIHAKHYLDACLQMSHYLNENHVYPLLWKRAFFLSSSAPYGIVQHR